MPLPNAVTTSSEADEMLMSIVQFMQVDVPFVAQVAQLAMQARTLDEREVAVVSLYLLGLEQHQPYVSDLANELLCWIERERELAA